MRWCHVLLGLAAASALAAAPAAAQVTTIDPNRAIDGDLPPSRTTPPPSRTQAAPAWSEPVPAEPLPAQQPADLPPPPADATAPASGPAFTTAQGEQRADATTTAAATFKREDLIGAGEGVFGKGAEGLAGILEKILREQGEPNAYIAGREAAGAFVVGVRYGSGIMTHKVEGQMPVYWTGPSIGFDAGGDANKVFVLVYNLYDTAELYKRFPAAEGRLYLVGGFAATYLRRGSVVLIPIRLGVGWRAGVNVGYMRFSHKSKWIPF
jgi:hypothetical protein